ncbi:MAG: methionyl-tRNA formyltransferase [bacterium]
MRIVFMGTPEFALPTLQILLDHHREVVAVVTVPDKPQGRGQQLAASPVKSFALQHHLLLLQPVRLNDPEFILELQNLHADLFIVAAFRILPKEVYSIPSKGSFNLHASLLPKYRGAAPINWAIINGEVETGVTTFFLKEKVDTGSIILQRKIQIGADETAGDIHDRLSLLGAEVIYRTLEMIEHDNVQPRAQDESGASSAPKIFREDCRIPWHSTSRHIHNVVRGLSPHPCAWTIHKQKVLRIYRTQLVDSAGSPQMIYPPGTVVDVQKNLLLVRTMDGLISILEVQQEGRKRLGIEEFLRGYSIYESDILS